MGDNKMKDEAEQGFNDAELQDIMNEIESLEKEFVSPDEESESQDLHLSEDTPHAEEIEKTDLQRAIDEEMQSIETQASLGEIEESMIDLDESVDSSEDEFSDSDFDDEGDTLMPESSAPVSPIRPSPMTSVPSQMEFSASGQMDLNLSFQVAQHIASLTVADSCLKVELNGVTIHIDGEEGCKIELAGGGTFSFPLQGLSAKKAA